MFSLGKPLEIKAGLRSILALLNSHCVCIQDAMNLVKAPNLFVLMDNHTVQWSEVHLDL